MHYLITTLIRALFSAAATIVISLLMNGSRVKLTPV